jgi:hypothetical protein
MKEDLEAPENKWLTKDEALVEIQRQGDSKMMKTVIFIVFSVISTSLSFVLQNIYMSMALTLVFSLIACLNSVLHASSSTMLMNSKFEVAILEKHNRLLSSSFVRDVFEDAVPKDNKTIEQKLGEALKSEDYEEAARLQKLLDENSSEGK